MISAPLVADVCRLVVPDAASAGAFMPSSTAANVIAAAPMNAAAPVIDCLGSSRSLSMVKPLIC